MKTFIVGSVAATALALSIGAASAQSQREADGAVALTLSSGRSSGTLSETNYRIGLETGLPTGSPSFHRSSGKPSEAPSSKDLQQKSAKGFPTGSQTSSVQAPVSLVKGCRVRSATVFRSGLPSSRRSNEQPSAPS